MSEKHPIIAVTGSSGAGTTTVKRAFEHIFRREKITPAIIEGDSFHRYNRIEMREAIKTFQAEGKTISHFGPEGNDFGRLCQLFQSYGHSGMGEKRYYIHNADEAEFHGKRLNISVGSGEFTPWEPVEADTDLLFYEGLHGGVVTAEHNVAELVDLLVGVVPIVNLEWIQKIHRDNAERGYSAEAIVDTILRRMPDYINYITPQFSRTHINFQRVPTVDTSNPFIARDIPTPDESFIVIHFSDPKRFDVDFQYLLAMIQDAFMSRRDTIVVPGGKMSFAMEIILTPIMHRVLEKRRRLLQG